MCRTLQSNTLFIKKESVKKMTVDLKNKFAVENGEYLILNGKIINSDIAAIQTVTEPLLNRLYRNYKHSVPDYDNPCQQDSIYFRALDITELSDDDLRTNIPRDKARTALELAVLVGYIRGDLIIDKSKWFWQSSEEPDFMILRKWII